MVELVELVDAEFYVYARSEVYTGGSMMGPNEKNEKNPVLSHPVIIYSEWLTVSMH